MKEVQLALAMLVLFSSCSQEAERAVWVNVSVKDSTFIEKYADIYIDSIASIGSELRLKPLSDYEGEVIRVRNESGWGTFDAIATIYRDTDCNIQMVKQNIGSRRAPRGFQIQEYSMPLNKCDTIFEMVDNKEFYNLPFDLDPDWIILDGNTYSISYRGSKKTIITIIVKN
jgi:hypothetical protein